MTLDVGYSPIFENDKNVKTKATLAHLLIDLKANRKALQNPTKIDLILLPVPVWQLNKAFKFVEKCGGVVANIYSPTTSSCHASFAIRRHYSRQSTSNIPDNRPPPTNASPNHIIPIYSNINIPQRRRPVFPTRGQASPTGG